MYTVTYRVHKVFAQLHFVPVVGTQALDPCYCTVMHKKRLHFVSNFIPGLDNCLKCVNVTRLININITSYETYITQVA